LPGAGWSVAVPRFYFDAGVNLALPGSAQNLFANLGLTVHVPTVATNMTIDAL
jgi:hypothetical protein